MSTRLKHIALWSVAGRSRGQAMIYTAIMFMTLFAFAALVADGGLLWLNRRHMQNSVDAAALAAVQNLPKMPNDTSGARPIACNYATVRNAVPNMVVSCADQAESGGLACNTPTSPDIFVCRTFIDNDSVKVTARMNYRPLIGSALGWTNIEIKTSATAVIATVNSACIGPLFQTQDLLQASGVWGSNGLVMNQQTIMKFSTDGSTAGNFLALDLGNGGAEMRDRLATPAICASDTAPQASGTVNRLTGNLIGPFSQGMRDRQAAWTAQGNCPNPNATAYLRADGLLANGDLVLNPSNCYRMIVIPIIAGTFSEFNGTGTANVIAFAVFYISDWCGTGNCPRVPAMNNGELLGYYVTSLAGGWKPYSGYNGYGIKVVALLS